jgi:uncharacterized protein YbaR (Trm112 family)
MKPWLFDILACPIDKHFPLKLFIFSFENTDKDFDEILKIYETKNLESIKKEELIEISEENNEIFIKDNIIIEKNLIAKYIQLIISSINEQENITDKTNSEISKKCFNLILTDIKNNIIEFSKLLETNKIDNILPDLFLLNKIKLEIEIESGILFCEKCNRWFPIIETIPQMLPDEYRDEEKEKEFLKTNKSLLDAEFLNKDLKPFSI